MGTYKALLPQHIRVFFLFFYSSASVTIVHSILALKSTVATVEPSSVKGVPLVSGLSLGVGFFCIPILVAKWIRERAGALGPWFSTLLSC